VNSRKTLRRLLVAGLTACALSALTAGTAFAAEATWSPAGSMAWTNSSFTLSYNGSSTTCTEYAPSWTGVAVGSEYELTNHFPATSQATCTGGKLFEIVAFGVATKEGGVFHISLGASGGMANLPSPFGTYTQDLEAVGKFVNGSGGTASTVTFENQPIGERFAKPLKITGTFKVTTGSGGLMTLK
jgi:hypothetical protein